MNNNCNLWRRRWDARCPLRGPYPWAVGSCGGLGINTIPVVPVSPVVPQPVMPIVPSGNWGCSTINGGYNICNNGCGNNTCNRGVNMNNNMCNNMYNNMYNQGMYNNMYNQGMCNNRYNRSSYFNTSRPQELDYRVGGPGNPSAIRYKGEEKSPPVQTIIVLGESAKTHQGPQDMEQRKMRRKVRRQTRRRKNQEKKTFTE